ncbi:MAG: tail fiber domain-containing protein [Candidatus Omnitrophica bacterium]|nr:tail fiber domain-containing protein [Candidatus Omnitrophota bacterium]
MLKRNFKIIFITLLLPLTFTSISWGGNLILKTYYAAPQGAYDRMTLIPQSSLPTPCTIGTLVVEESTGKLFYCHNIGGIGTWGSMNNTWTQTGNYVYPTTTTTNPLIYLGIGTSTPSFKLTLENDGGILATGTFAAGATLTSLTGSRIGQDNSRLIWYPRKGSFRAIVDSTGITNDATTGDYSVAFGKNNTAQNTGTTVSGQSNVLTGNYATIAGGNTNSATNSYVTITGGQNNAASGQYSVISGFSNNTASGTYNTIFAGSSNTADGVGQALSGTSNIIQGSGNYATITGGSNNLSSGNYTVISGLGSNIASGNFATITGATLMTASGSHSTYTGYSYRGNTGSASGAYSTVSGMYHNASGDWSAITGGGRNTTSGNYATVSGGSNNIVTGMSSVIGGQASNNISGNYSVIASSVGNINNGNYSTVLGGDDLVLDNSSHRTFVFNYFDSYLTVSSADSFILARAKLSIREVSPTASLSITSNGADDYLAVTSTSAAAAGDIFFVKNNGYVGIGQPTPTHPLHFGAQANNAYLTTGGIFTTPSSRAYKDNIKTLDTQDAIDTTLKLRPVTYNYKADKNERHVGFIAEDVPDLVAAQGRKSIDPMNVTAVLTAVLKQQKKDIAHQGENLNQMETELQNLKAELQHR